MKREVPVSQCGLATLSDIQMLPPFVFLAEQPEKSYVKTKFRTEQTRTTPNVFLPWGLPQICAIVQDTYCSQDVSKTFCFSSVKCSSHQSVGKCSTMQTLEVMNSSNRKDLESTQPQKRHSQKKENPAVTSPTGNTVEIFALV